MHFGEGLELRLGLPSSVSSGEANPQSTDSDKDTHESKRLIRAVKTFIKNLLHCMLKESC